ncbi:MAG: 2OG-Fe(II) oxygenase [Rhodospirillales bacterium]
MEQQISDRIAVVDWAALQAALDENGFAVTPSLLTPKQCRELIALYGEEAAFRSRVIMQRHAFGRGEYQYFRYALPEPVQQLRESLYPQLAPVAQGWAERLGEETKFPPNLKAYLTRCHAAGQKRPTPLLLKYGAGDYNCLHQDLYGEQVFPLQATILLSDAQQNFDGGEFMLVEQRPRQQSKGEVVPLQQGQAVIFAVNSRPVKGSRGYYRAKLRHGVSRIRSGNRFTLGIIFHDAM